MRISGIFLVLVSVPFCLNVNSSPVEMELEAKGDSEANSSSPEIHTELTITMATETAKATAAGVAQEIKIPTKITPANETEKTATRRKCSGNGNRTQIKSGNERLIPFPLCKPIQGLFYTGLCAVVCNIPLKSDENTCRFSNDDKTVFCDCNGAEEGKTAACGSGLERQTVCHFSELSSSAKVCRNICRKLGKSYDFCLSPRHTRRAFCTCFDPSRTQRKGNQREIEDASEQIQHEIPPPALAPAPVSTKPLASLQAQVTETVQDDDDDVDVDFDDAEEESCDDNEDGNGTVTGNGTAIKNLRQQNIGSCHPVLGAYFTKLCTGICGGSVKTCRVNREYRTVFCDCPGNEEGPQAFCGRPAEMYNHCFAATVPDKQDCQNLCSQTGKRGEICISPQNSQTRTMCSCFTG